MTPPSMTFQETAPSSIRLSPRVLMGVAPVWITVFVANSLVHKDWLYYLLFSSALLVAALFVYRFGRRYTTTVYCSDGVLTVSRRSIIPGLSPEPLSVTLGTKVNVELAPTSGWWQAAQILLMEGDRPQEFTDLALSTVQPDGKVERYAVSRDRRAAEQLLPRREELRRLVAAGSSTQLASVSSDKGFSL